MSKSSRLVSTVWKHFDRMGAGAKCHYCKNIFAFSSGSTANLKRHLARKHPLDPLDGSLVSSLNEMVESEPSSPTDEEQSWNDRNDSNNGNGENDGNDTWNDGIEGIIIPKIEHRSSPVESIPKGTVASSVWQHYDRDGTSAKCHYCLKMIAFSSGSTSNLKKHLVRKHPAASFDTQSISAEQQDEEQAPEPSSPWSEGIEVPKQELLVGSSKLQADIWNHYDRDGTLAKCHYCFKEISFSSGATSNLKKHLTRKHPMITFKTRPLKKRVMLDRKAKTSPASNNSFTAAFHRNGRGVSNVWNHFDRNGATARCQHCLKTFVYTGSTSNLCRHLNRKHPSTQQSNTMTRIHHAAKTFPKARSESPDFMPEKYFPTAFVSIPTETSDTETPAGATGAAAAAPQSSAPPARQIFTEAMYYQLCVKLLLMICRGNHSLCIVNEEAFQDVFAVPQITNKRELKHVILPQVFEVAQKNVKAELAGARTIALSVNSWESINHETVLNVTSYFIDRDGKMSSALLDFAPVVESATADNVAAHVTEVLKAFDIEGKVESIVTDAQSDMIQTAVVEKLNIPHVPCFVHSLQPIVRLAVEKTVHSTLEEVRHVVTQFTKSAQAKAKLKEAQQSITEDTVKLILDDASSWNTTLDMLGRFLRSKEPILFCLPYVNVTSKLESKDWLVIEQVIKVLQLLDAATADVLAENAVTASKPVVLYNLLVARLESIVAEQNEPLEVTLLAETLLKGIKEGLGFIKHNKVLTQAVILDPRYKVEGFMQDDECINSTYETVITDITSLQSDEDSPTSEDHDASATQSERSEDDLYNLFESHKRSQHDTTALKVSAQYELSYYLKAKHLSRTANPLEWWENNKHFYPVLYKLAFKVLCTPAACVSSTGCCTKTEVECRERTDKLITKTISQMVFLKYNHRRTKTNDRDV
uniref:BED-type domain-containing protein n=1 Tax=Anopheles epiroticus TaxID=199890 RepID=A0A182PAM3_9DIPT